MTNVRDSDRSYPRIRFNGYSDAWQKRDLKEMGKIYTGNTPPTANESNWSTSQSGHIWVTPTDIDKLTIHQSFKHLTDVGWSKSRNVPAYSVLITCIASIGKNTINTVPVAFNQQINAIIPVQHDSFFILAVMTRETNRLKSIAGQTATAMINKSTFEKFNIIVPSLMEQTQIGTFFQSINNLITVNQRKVEKYQALKKALLQRMFVSGDSDIPQIRFNGYSEAWQKRKLGSFTETYSGGTPSADNSKYYGGDIPFIRSAEINLDKTKLYLTEAGLNNSSAKLVAVGDILYAMYGATSGEVGVSRINGAINQAILAIKPTQNDDPQFIMQWLRNQKEHIVNIYLQGGQGNLSGTIVKKLEIETPVENSEELRIGIISQSLDNLITVNQRKVETYKELKKALLQQMFV
ncbi:restriction endonuclease subunit S [Convivina praedatoris]|uniref:restriction endonuclease subunit S n=1 Tax=Convivina praedatoris TaxID=2880963 RepID=UPI0020105A25|nr:restriction endonuclease subunit S [Convivina sp. LMG 32447]CAH1855465.1 hypothetical protein R077815_01224 [Convivina sp. LMG 32447]